MTIGQFEHVLRACQGNTDESGFYIIGTASLLAQHPELAEGCSGVITDLNGNKFPADSSSNSVSKKFVVAHKRLKIIVLGFAKKACLITRLCSRLPLWASLREANLFSARLNVQRACDI